MTKQIEKMLENLSADIGIARKAANKAKLAAHESRTAHEAEVRSLLAVISGDYTETDAATFERLKTHG